MSFISRLLFFAPRGRASFGTSQENRKVIHAELHLGLAIAAFGVTTSMNAATLLNENFNGLATQLGATSAGSFSTINGTNVDIVGASNGFGALCASPASGNCIDLDGTNGNPISQLRSNTQFGAGSYLLSFDLIGNGREVPAAPP